MLQRIFFCGTYIGTALFILLTAPYASSAASLTQNLSSGSTGSEVTQLQQSLKIWGYYTYPEITGYYGPVTQKAVEAFQTAEQIVTTGTPNTTGFGAVGPRTRAVFNAKLGTGIATTPMAISTQVFFLTRDLWLGVTHPEVAILQQFLKTKGYYTYPEITGYFGPHTKEALTAYQQVAGIPALGGVGPDTRTRINQELAKSTTSIGSTAVPTLTTPKPGTTSSSTATTTTTTTTTSTPRRSGGGGGSSGGGGGGGSTADTTAPTVSLTTPSDGATVSGATVSVTATAADNVAVTGVQFKLNGTNLGSEDTSAPYSVVWDSTATANGTSTLIAVARDAAGNYATSTSVAVNVDNSSGGSIVLNDQSLSFGSLTLAAAGGYNLVTASSTITNATITGGNGSGHWQISATGQITPTVTGDTANLNAGPYVLAVAVSDGVATDTANVTINTDALTYDVRTKSELEAAVGAAETLSNTSDYTVFLRDDATVAGANIYGITMQGALVDVNNGANEASYNYNATSTFTGGSVHISARTAFAPAISGQLHVLGSTGVIVSGLRFTSVPSTDSYNRDDGGPNSNDLAAATHYQVLVSDNGTYPTETTIIFKNNQFGGYAVNQNPLRWGHGIRVDVADTVIVEDNTFDGVYIASTFGGVKRGVGRRNSIRRQLNDAIRAMGNRISDLSSFTSQRVELTSNTIWHMSSSSDWAGAHSDGIQIGTTLDEVNYDVLVKRNYIYLPVEAVSYPGETTQRSSQGIYMDDTVAPVAITGVVSENFVMTTALSGINVWEGSLTVHNNTVLKSTLHQEPATNSNGSRIRVHRGSGHLIYDNIVEAVNAEGGAFFEHDNHFIAFGQASGTASSFYNSFFGPFTVGAYGPAWVLDESSVATIQSSLDSIFAPRTGSLAVNRGYTYSANDRTPAALSFATLTNQATGTVVYTYQHITSITDDTYVVPTGIEWGVATSTDYNGVSTWTSMQGTIDANQYLHLRMTTSASGDATSTGVIQVGSASTTWAAVTGAGGYAATGIDFDGTNDALTTSAFTGAASNQGTISLWLYRNDASWATTSDRLIEMRNSGGSERISLYAATTGRLTFIIRNAANSVILNYNTPGSTFLPNTWYHLLLSYNLASSTFQVYKNDASVSTAGATMSNDTAEALGRAGVGAGSGASGKWKGYLADVFYHPTFLDLSSSTNRRLFISGIGRPVDLGLTGTTPFGTQPILYMSGAASTWQTNKGTGGGFTEVGDITAAPSNP